MGRACIQTYEAKKHVDGRGSLTMVNNEITFERRRRPHACPLHWRASGQWASSARALHDNKV